MPVKVYFNTHIHRFAKLPQTFPALIDHITSLFKTELPSKWSLQYLDSDGDHIIVSHEHDFKELLEIESSTNTLKLYILPTENSAQQIASESHKPQTEAKYPSFEEYEVIQSSPMVQHGLINTSQNQVEETANADNKINNDHHQQEQKIEVEQPQVIPQPEKEGSNETNPNTLKFQRAKQLIKIMVRGKNPETKDQLLGELNAIKDSLTEKEKKRLEAQLEKLEIRLKEEDAKKANPSQPPKEQEVKKVDKKEEKARKLLTLLKFVKTFRSFIQTQKKGNTEKAAQLKERLRVLVPEKGKLVLEPIMSSLDQEFDKEMIIQRLTEGVQKLIEEYSPEGKEQILEELKQMNENIVNEKRNIENQKRKKSEEKRASAEKCQQEKSELKEKYAQGVFKKATVMKIIFVKERLANLCEYVNNKPEQSSMEELVFEFRK